MSKTARSRQRLSVSVWPSSEHWMVGRSLALLASKLEETFAQLPLGVTGMPIAHGRI